MQTDVPEALGVGIDSGRRSGGEVHEDFDGINDGRATTLDYRAGQQPPQFGAAARRRDVGRLAAMRSLRCNFGIR
ncbi:hypothetical protein [Variovorax sp. PBS-H4]|uniref:hypothetical protein n=1 Tax=Variovorax sp. PBS-H4 TaxID=434008 RepID=UPI0013A5B6E9|nr:hypothetical protein [Variovorax sp. PBS-H4]